ncbi:hypothetical protein ACOMHN_056562 [Nucella lapillus]
MAQRRKVSPDQESWTVKGVELYGRRTSDPAPLWKEAYGRGRHNCCSRAAQADRNAPVGRRFPAAYLCLGRRFHS